MYRIFFELLSHIKTSDASAAEAPSPTINKAREAKNKLHPDHNGRASSSSLQTSAIIAEDHDANPVCNSIAEYKIRPGDSAREAQLKQGERRETISPQKLAPTIKGRPKYGTACLPCELQQEFLRFELP